MKRYANGDVDASRPARGAWIEILPLPLSLISSTGRAPHGARGLKYSHPGYNRASSMSRPARGAWIEISRILAKSPISSVAPRTGRVD